MSSSRDCGVPPPRACLHLGAGRVTRVQHARSECPPSRASATRPSAARSNATPSDSSSAKRVAGLADDRTDDVRLAQALPDHERVREVQLHRVGLPDRAGDAALCIPGVGLGDLALGDEQHARELRRLERGHKSRDAAADDENVAFTACERVGVEAEQVAGNGRGVHPSATIRSTAASARPRISSATVTSPVMSRRQSRTLVSVVSFMLGQSILGSTL